MHVRRLGEKQKLIILGAGGHARVVADAALEAGFCLAGFVDDKLTDPPLPGFAILGRVSNLPAILAEHPEAALVAAVGDNQARRRLVELVRDLAPPREFASIRHPASIISAFASLGSGTVCLAGAIVNAGAQVGAHVILNTACSVDHDGWIGDYAHISPGAHLAGNVAVETGGHIGTGAAVIPGRKVGAWAVVGAGAVVVQDVPARTVAAGVPARKLREIRLEAAD